jgi:hypothetical protein
VDLGAVGMGVRGDRRAAEHEERCEREVLEPEELLGVDAGGVEEGAQPVLVVGMPLGDVGELLRGQQFSSRGRRSRAGGQNVETGRASRATQRVLERLGWWAQCGAHSAIGDEHRAAALDTVTAPRERPMSAGDDQRAILAALPGRASPHGKPASPLLLEGVERSQEAVHHLVAEGVAVRAGELVGATRAAVRYGQLMSG